MKLAVTGKGGAGKTTVAVFLARYLADLGKPVILIDADPDANTAMTLGLNPASQPAPISELKDLIAERTGSNGVGGGLFALNPRVDDIPERYSVQVGGIRLLRMGRLAKGGAGCFCPENAFLKSLLAHLIFQREDVVILEFGANDLGWAYKDVNRYVANTRDLITKAKKKTSQIIILSPTTGGNIPSMSDEISKGIRKLADDEKVAYVDITKWSMYRGEKFAWAYLANEYHPDFMGHAMIAELIAPLFTGGNFDWPEYVKK